MRDSSIDPRMNKITETFRDLGLECDKTRYNLQKLSELADSDWPVKGNPSENPPVTSNNTTE